MKSRAINIVCFCSMMLYSGMACSQNKMQLGITAEAGAKLYPVRYYNTFAMAQLTATLRIDNEQPHTLGLLLGFGFLLDPASYKLESESTNANKVFVTMMQRNLSFSGLIVFPTKHEAVKILAGIGIDYNMTTDASYNIRGSNSTSSFHTGMGLDSIQAQINESRKKLLPSAGIGLQYQFAKMKRVKLHCLFRQNLLNSFDKDIPVYEISTGKTGQGPTNYKPGYLKLGMSFDFW